MVTVRNSSKIVVRLLLLLAAFIPIGFGLASVTILLTPTGPFDGGIYLRELNAVVFVGDYDRMQRFYWLNLETEQIRELRSPGLFGLWDYLAYIDSDGHVLGVTPDNSLARTSFKTSSAKIVGDFRRVLVGKRYLVGPGFAPNGESALEWRDLTDESATNRYRSFKGLRADSLSPVEGAAAFYSVRDVSDIRNKRRRRNYRKGAPKKFRSQLCELTLFRVDDDDITVTQSLLTYISEVYTEAGKIVCLSPQRDAIQVHESETGKLIASYPADAGTMTDWSLYNSVVTIRYANRPADNYCIANGRQMQIPNAFRNLVFDRNDELYLTVAADGIVTGNDWNPQIQVRDIANDAIRSQFPFPSPDIPVGWPPGSIYLVENEEVLFLTSDHRAIFVDRTSGRITRKVEPMRRLKILSMLCGVVAICWWAIWLNATKQIPCFTIVNVLIGAALLLWLLRMRLINTGSIHDGGRLAWQCVGFVATFLGLLAAFFAFSNRCRFEIRILPGLVFVIASLYAYDQFWQSDYTRRQLILCSTGTMIFLVTAVALVPRLNPLRVRRKPDAPPISRSVQWTFGKLLLVMTLVACGVAYLQQQKWEDWDYHFQTVRVTGVLSKSFECAISVYATWCLVFPRRRFWMRCIVAGLMLTLACVVAYLPHGWFNRPFLMWDTYYFEQTIKSLVAAVTTATILTLPFRVRLSVEEQIVS